MRVSLCVGRYATIPYGFKALNVRIFSVEELCYCLKENAFLLDETLMNERLAEWIGRECGLSDLAGDLYGQIRREGSLSVFVVTILKYVGLYDDATIAEVERIMKRGAGLNGKAKRKIRIDYMVEKGRYIAALKEYEELISSEDGTDPEFAAAILHNMGVALVGMMLYKAGAERFRESYATFRREETLKAFLCAKRLELGEQGYVEFIAEHGEFFDISMEVEREVKACEEDFKETENFKRIEDRTAWRVVNKQKYYDDNESLAVTLKNKYRIYAGE